MREGEKDRWEEIEGAEMGERQSSERKGEDSEKLICM